MKFNKTMRIGRKADVGNVYAKITFKNSKLSISGVEGPVGSGDCRGGAGQIDMHMDAEYFTDMDFAQGWNIKKALKFVSIWDKWHLNDMRAGCKHQRNLNASEKIKIIDYSWSTKYHDMRRKSADGSLSAKEYALFQEISPLVQDATTSTTRPKYPTDTVKALLNNGWIEEGKKEMKTRGWVGSNEHPRGLLGLVCDKCGYKYGSAWLMEEVPADVIEWLAMLPKTDKTPAWV